MTRIIKTNNTNTMRITSSNVAVFWIETRTKAKASCKFRQQSLYKTEAQAIRAFDMAINQI